MKHLIRFVTLFAIVLLVSLDARAERPNIILMMADDLGYGDTGFSGNTIIQTPHLDHWASEGALFRHFYSGSSVCSPTRGSCLTGRHPYRYGIYSANAGHLPAEEVTLARMLKSKGYTTGHFGKWHLGTLDTVISSKGPRRNPAENFAPPWQRDYDRSFVTESAIQLWNPGQGRRAKDNPFYDDGVRVDPNDETLLGGASRVVVDRAVPFIEAAVKDQLPFLAVVWFHAPHEDVVAGPDYLTMYDGHKEAAHYYGCVTEMDDQVGRIRRTLEELDATENTLIFFCSDNGPEGSAPGGRRAGVTNGLRGRKRSLYDGGVRVPAFVVWPGRIDAASTVELPCSTLDYFPTIQQIVGFEMPDERPIDGQDIMPIIRGETTHRSRSIPFRYGDWATLVKDEFKLVLPTGELFELSNDWSEHSNVAMAHPERVEQMTAELLNSLTSFRASHAGSDYNAPDFQPVDHWRPLRTSDDE